MKEYLLGIKKYFNANNVILLIHFGENTMADKVVIHAVNESDSRLIEYNDHIIGSISTDGVYHGTPLTGVANADGTITIMHNGEQIGTITTPNTATIQPGDVITISPPPESNHPVSDAIINLFRALTGTLQAPPHQPNNNTIPIGGIRGEIENYLQNIGDLLLPAKANASGTPSSSGSGSGSSSGSSSGSGYDPGSGFDPLANNKYGDSQTFRRDPLVLDLNNNGIETVGINTASLILFDQNADGVKTATGWISANDGLLVWDRNGNGTIDNGRELFGDSTIKSDGTLATNGFNALADLDSNHDGIVNDQDADFANLRIWRDLNQDGISQSSELSTLDTYQIAGINLNTTTVNTAQNNGNILTETGSYIISGGATGLAGVLNLIENPFYSQFTDPLPLTAEIQALPDMRGAGMVRDLRDAASRSPELAATLSQYSAASSDIQKSMLNNLLTQWFATSTFSTTAARAATLTNGVSHTTITLEGIATGTPDYTAFMDKLSLVEKLNGRTFHELPVDPSATLSYTILHEQQVLIEQSYQALTNSVYDHLLVQTRFRPYLDAISLKINADGISVDTSGIDTTLDALSLTDGKAALLDILELDRLLGSKLKSMGWIGADTDRLAAYAGKVSIDSQLQEELNNWHIRIGNGTVTAVAGDKYVFGQSSNDVLDSSSSDGALIIGGAGNDHLIGGSGADTYQFNRGDGQDVITDYDMLSIGKVDKIVFGAGIAQSDLFLSRASDSSLVIKINDPANALAANQITVANWFGDSRYRIELVQFADGSSLTAAQLTAMDKVIYGTNGNDTLTGGIGNDTVDGGLGNDNMSGGAGNDTYIVDSTLDVISENLNEGSDLVLSSVSYTLASNAENLTLTGETDIIGTGNALSNILIGNANDNVLNGAAGNDTLTGSEGVDHFVFNTTLGASNIDTLTDFVSGTDKIELSRTVFTIFNGLALGSSLADAELGNHLLYDSSSGALSYDGDGSAGAGVSVQIAWVGTTSHPTVVLGDDFNIVA